MKKDGFTLKDSGKRETFESGMVRDTREGKGRFDLVTPFGLLRLSKIYEKGGIKYAPRNWEKGAPYSRFIDSALRHIMQFMMGMEDEDHLAQASWNLFAVMHFQELGRTDLDDMPHYLAEKQKETVEEKCPNCGNKLELIITSKRQPADIGACNRCCDFFFLDQIKK